LSSTDWALESTLIPFATVRPVFVSSTYRFHWSKSVAQWIVISTPSPGMSVGPSGYSRVVPAGAGLSGPLGNVPLGSSSFSKKLSHVLSVQVCSVGGPNPDPVGSALRPLHVTT